MFNFNEIIDFPKFLEQLEIMLSDSNYLLRLSFELFDTNNDEKISELDLYKVITNFKTDSSEFMFMDILYPDIVTLKSKLSKFSEHKFQELVKENGGDQTFIGRMQDFRNLQRMDPQY